MSQRNSMLCPKCRKLISRDEKICPYCSLLRPGSSLNTPFPWSGMDPELFIKTIIGVNVVMYLLSIFLSPGRANFGLSPFSFISPSHESLFLLGSTGVIPTMQGNRWWTLISANYLHGGLLHILFNMLALRQLGPLVLREYGASRMFAIYTLGGVGGFLLSIFAGIRFTIGASSAVCALIGALLYFGKSRGGHYGNAVYSQLAGWAMSIFFFGFMVPSINNWAHFGGMVSGWCCGYFLGYEERGRENRLHHGIAWLCLAATALALAWGCLTGIVIKLLS